MHWEVEQKYRLPDAEPFLAACSAHGILLGPPVRQIDNYFNHPARDFAQTDEALRIRQVGERNFVTYKGPKIDSTTKTRQETELELPSGEQVAEQYRRLLEQLSFRFVATVAKSRRTGTISHDGLTFEVALDDVEGLGHFLELETTADDAGLNHARAAMHALARQLQLEHAERQSYLELILTARSRA